MTTPFTKYQSLSNDFIIFDWYNESENHISTLTTHKNWPLFVSKLCNRHMGVGADGVLIIKQTRSGLFKSPQVLIFNADGSDGQLCLNGARCITHYLHNQHGFGESFHILMGNKKIECHANRDGIITNSLLLANPAIEKKVITTDCGQFEGYAINIGNPHFVIMQQTSKSWLSKNGKIIENHPEFPHKTNVEFLWLPRVVKKREFPAFSMLIHERGCGITHACSSGAVAATLCLFHEKIVKKDTKTTLYMPGGSLITQISDSKVLLQATAHLVFQGQIDKFS